MKKENPIIEAIQSQALQSDKHLKDAKKIYVMQRHKQFDEENSFEKVYGEEFKIKVHQAYEKFMQQNKNDKTSNKKFDPTFSKIKKETFREKYVKFKEDQDKYFESEFNKIYGELGQDKGIQQIQQKLERNPNSIFSRTSNFRSNTLNQEEEQIQQQGKVQMLQQ